MQLLVFLYVIALSFQHLEFRLNLLLWRYPCEVRGGVLSIKLEDIENHNHLYRSILKLKYNTLDLTYYMPLNECGAYTLHLKRYQLLFANPLTFHIPSLDSGCVLNAISTPLQLNSTVLPSSHTSAGIALLCQNTQAHARPKGWSSP